MKNEVILIAIGKISDELIIDAAINNTEHKPIIKRVFRWKSLVAAILVVLLLAMPVSAETVNGYISNLLAPVYGYAQTEIIDKIGRPIGASCSADGYTLTADAFVGDRNNVAVVYTLTKDDGKAIPESVVFEDWETVLLGGMTGGGSLIIVRNEDDPSQIYLIESWHNKAPVIGRLVQASFSNLAMEDNSGNQLLAEGPWEVKYTLRYDDSSVSVPVNDFTVTDGSGKKIKIDKMQVSPLGLYLELTIFDPAWQEPPLRHFDVAVHLTDGTIIEMKGGGGGGGHQKGDKTMAASYSAFFEIPVDLGSVETIVICGTSYAVDLDD